MLPEHKTASHRTAAMIASTHSGSQTLHSTLPMKSLNTREDNMLCVHYVFQSAKKVCNSPNVCFALKPALLLLFTWCPAPKKACKYSLSCSMSTRAGSTRSARLPSWFQKLSPIFRMPADFTWIQC